MLLRGFLFVILGGWGLAQSVPLGYGLEEGTRILVFTAPECTVCESLATMKGFPLTFVGRIENLPFHPYLHDRGDLLARALRIQSAPTLVVLKDGWEVKRLTGKINPSAKALALLVDAAEAGLLSPAYTLAVSLGQIAPAPYQDFSGLLVFGYEQCRWCDLEKESRPYFVSSQSAYGSFIAKGGGRKPAKVS
jgi:thiol-disulfide isomerase/thioredoxin